MRCVCDEHGYALQFSPFGSGDLKTILPDEIEFFLTLKVTTSKEKKKEKEDHHTSKPSV